MGNPVDKSCRMINLQLHVANSLLLFLVSSHLLLNQRMYSSTMREPTCALTAILFALHPTRSEVVFLDKSITISLSLSCSLIATMLLLRAVQKNNSFVVVVISLSFSSCFYGLGAWVMNAHSSSSSSSSSVSWGGFAEVPMAILFAVACGALHLSKSKTKLHLLFCLCLFVPIIVFGFKYLHTLFSDVLQAPSTSQQGNCSNINISSNITNDKSNNNSNNSKKKGSKDPVPVESAMNISSSCSTNSSNSALFQNSVESNDVFKDGSVIVKALVGMCQVLWWQASTIVSTRSTEAPTVPLWSVIAVENHSLWLQAFLGFLAPCLVSLVGRTLYMLFVSRTHVSGWSVTLIVLFVLCSRFSFSKSQALHNSLYMYTPACFLHIILAIALNDAWAASALPTLSKSHLGTKTQIMETQSDTGIMSRHSPPMSSFCSTIYFVVISLVIVMFLQASVQTS